MRIYDNVTIKPKKEITKRFICLLGDTTARLLISTILQDKDAYFAFVSAKAKTYYKEVHGQNQIRRKKYAPELLIESLKAKLNYLIRGT